MWRGTLVSVHKAIQPSSLRAGCVVVPCRVLAGETRFNLEFNEVDFTASVPQAHMHISMLDIGPVCVHCV